MHASFPWNYNALLELPCDNFFPACILGRNHWYCGTLFSRINSLKTPSPLLCWCTVETTFIYTIMSFLNLVLMWEERIYYRVQCLLNVCCILGLMRPCLPIFFSAHSTFTMIFLLNLTSCVILDVYSWSHGLVIGFHPMEVWWPSTLSYWMRFFAAIWQSFHGWIFLLHLQNHIWWILLHRKAKLPAFLFSLTKYLQWGDVWNEASGLVPIVSLWSSRQLLLATSGFLLCCLLIVQLS